MEISEIRKNVVNQLNLKQMRDMVLVLKKGATKKEIAAIRKKLEKLPTKGVDT